MGLNKETKTAVADAPVAEAPKAESGTEAALERLSKAVDKIEPRHEAAVKPPYKQRDFDAEARGKTRCVQFEAALMSPAIAGMQFNTMEEYLKLVKQAANAGVAYSFEE